MVPLIPILWKCLIRRYLTLFTLATGSIILLLLASRLEDIAKFVAIGASPLKVFLFTLYQIPYILQIALPIGGFIAGYTLSLRMSQSGEITMLRSVGRSILNIFAPILITSSFTALLTFLFLFDLAVKSHFAAKKLEYDVQAHEPLALLQSGHFLSNHSIALELSGSLKTGAQAKNVLICLMPKDQGRLTLITFAKAQAETGAFTGEALTIFSTTPPKKSSSRHPETLCIENALRKMTPTNYIHEMTQKKNWHVGADHLQMSTVIAVQKDLGKKIALEKQIGKPSKVLLKRYGRFTSEPWRRISLSLAILTLTYVGLLFGITIQRIRHPFQIALAFIPFFLFIALYLMGKNIDEIPSIAIPSFIAPHIILLCIGYIKKNRVERGVSR
ncbi:MAG: LptF/LptG family permease [Chlamydia sp.]